MSVAESMLILAPIDQTGWAAASAGVAAGDPLASPRPERPAARGDDRLLDVAVAARREGLVEGVVLGIDRHDGDAQAARLAHEGGAGADEAFLVGEGQRAGRVSRRRRSAPVRRCR